RPRTHTSSRMPRQGRRLFRLDGDATPEPVRPRAKPGLARHGRAVELDPIEVVARGGDRAVHRLERHPTDVVAQKHRLDEGHAELEELLRVKERRVPAALEIHSAPLRPRGPRFDGRERARLETVLYEERREADLVSEDDRPLAAVRKDAAKERAERLRTTHLA